MIIDAILIGLVFSISTALLVLYIAKQYFSYEYNKPDKVKIPASAVTTDITKKNEILEELGQLNKEMKQILEEVKRSALVTEEFGGKILQKLDEISDKGVVAVGKVKDEAVLEENPAVNETTPAVPLKQKEINQDVKKDEEKEKVESCSSTETFKFKNDFILNQRNLFKENELKLIDEVLSLLDKEGHVSSVVSFQNDEETKFLKNWKNGDDVSYNIVQKASLREHTFNVTRELVNMLKEKNKKYWTIEYSKGIIASLLHDIGKLPSLRSSNVVYTKLTHQKISEKKAIELMEKYGFSEDFIKEVSTAVGNHHNSKVSPFTDFLRTADHKAREYEMLKYGKEITDTAIVLDLVNGKERFSKEFLPFFVEKLYPFINVKRKFRNKTLIHAFTFEGYIYFNMEIPLHLLAKDRRLKFPNFFYEESMESKEKSKKVIANTLRYYDYWKEEIKEPFFVSSYSIVLENGKTLSNQKRSAVSTNILEIIGKKVDDLPAPSEFKVKSIFISKKSTQKEK